MKQRQRSAVLRDLSPPLERAGTGPSEASAQLRRARRALVVYDVKPEWRSRHALAFFRRPVA